MPTPLYVMTPTTDTERIVILKHDIAALDEYTYTYTDLPVMETPNFLSAIFGSYWFYTSTKPLLQITSQLQYILTLEEELDEELNKPLPSYDGGASSKGNNNMKAGSSIQYLQERIEEIDNMIISSTNRDPEESLDSEKAYSHYINILLIKRILLKRLRREQRKDLTLAGHQRRDGVNVDQLRQKIANLEASHQRRMKEAFLKKGDKAILQANYLLAAIQYYKDQLE